MLCNDNLTNFISFALLQVGNESLSEGSSWTMHIKFLVVLALVFFSNGSQSSSGILEQC